MPLNEDGIMLSMPATAPDLAIHKLVNVCPANGARGLPTIHGKVMAFDADTGETLFILDGPTVTGRRTAAISMLGVDTFAARHAARIPADRHRHAGAQPSAGDRRTVSRRARVGEGQCARARRGVLRRASGQGA